MIVTLQNFYEVLQELIGEDVIALDTETTGLRPYHGDRLFSLILATSKNVYYFNFNFASDISEQETLPRSYLKELNPLFISPDIIWVGHNIKYDMHILAQEDIFLKGHIHDTMVTMRLIENDRFKYDLDSVAFDMLGEHKDSTVDDYIDEHGLWTKVVLQEGGDEEKIKHFDRVPFSLIVPYAEKDAVLALRLYYAQMAKLHEMSDNITKSNPGLPTIMNVYDNECELLPVVFDIERRGAKVDIDYCKRAVAHYKDKLGWHTTEFERLTGKNFKDSGKLFQEIFLAEKDKWVMTKEKRTKKPRKEAFVPQPSFESDVLKTFSHPAAGVILEYRDAKSHLDFFLGFLYHADKDGYIHADLQQDGTKTGRFSSREPNLQNMSKDEVEEGQEEIDFPVRRAIITNDENNYFSLSIDYKAAEYRLLVEYAQEKEWAKAIMAGEDPHIWTRDKINERIPAAIHLNRSKAKNCSFAQVYGCGDGKLAEMIGHTAEVAKKIKEVYFSTLRGVQRLIDNVKKTSKNRGHIINWLGRIYYVRTYKNPKTGRMESTEYKTPNALIQGGVGDIVKKAMIEVAEYLRDKRSYMFLMVHDELDFYIHKEEKYVIPRIQEIMESVFPGKLIKMEVSIESGSNLYDLEKI